MKKYIFTIKGTKIPTIVALLSLLWASGFVGVMYLIYETEASAKPISIEARIPDLTR